MSPRPTALLGLGESWNEWRDRIPGTGRVVAWGGACIPAQSRLQSRRLMVPPGLCPLSSGPTLSLTMEGSGLETGPWAWGQVQAEHLIGRGGWGSAWKKGCARRQC